MKRDPEPLGGVTERSLDRQLERLAPQLRDEGIAPGRDLWPAIEAEILRAEPRRRRSRGLPLWRAAALAASLLLVVGVGWLQYGAGPREALPGAAGGPGPAGGADDGLVLAAADDTAGDGLESSRRLLDDALAQLEEARRLDPGDAGLTRLVLMIQESRGDLIRGAARQLALPGR